MWLYYLITGTAIIFYIRFFILNSLLTPAARKATLIAALKAVWFIPIFFQGLVLIWISVLHFFPILRGFFLLFEKWVYSGKVKDEYDFLYLLSYITSTTLLLSLNFILGKKSLTKQIDAPAIFFKILYLGVSYLAVNLVFLNISLTNPLWLLPEKIVVFNNGFIMLLTALFFISITTISFLKQKMQTSFRYFQSGIFISTGYIIICILISILLFLLYVAAKTIG